MTHLQSIFKLHSRDKWSWIYIPLLIASSSFLVNFVVGFLVRGEDIYTGGILSIFVYMLVMGILAIVQTFPFALGMTIRRKDYFIGTSLIAGISSLFIAIILLIFAFFERQTGGWGVKLHFFSLPYLNDGTVLEQMIIYFFFLTYLFFLGFTISGVGRRFGKTGMFILAIGSLLTISAFLLFAHHLNWWKDIFQWIIAHTAFELSLWFIPLVIFHMVVSYLLLRRATI